jgi:hypothetical protein
MQWRSVPKYLLILALVSVAMFGSAASSQAGTITLTVSGDGIPGGMQSTSTTGTNFISLTPADPNFLFVFTGGQDANGVMTLTYSMSSQSAGVILPGGTITVNLTATGLTDLVASEFYSINTGFSPQVAGESGMVSASVAGTSLFTPMTFGMAGLNSANASTIPAGPADYTAVEQFVITLPAGPPGAQASGTISVTFLPAVPEPGTMALVLCGLAPLGAGFLLRRFR